MPDPDLDKKLSLVHQYLSAICPGCAVSQGTYDHDYREYRFTINDGDVGTLSIAREWLADRKPDDIQDELRRRGVSLNALKASGEDYCLVLSETTLLARLKQR